MLFKYHLRSWNFEEKYIPKLKIRDAFIWIEREDIFYKNIKKKKQSMRDKNIS